MDALIPFIDAFAKSADIEAGLGAASAGAEKTKTMSAAFGRSSYVTKEQLESEGGIPDPGAVGVVSILKGLAARPSS